MTVAVPSVLIQEAGAVVGARAAPRPLRFSYSLPAKIVHHLGPSVLRELVGVVSNLKYSIKIFLSYRHSIV